MLQAYYYVKSLITRKEEGATMVEYALMVALIALVAIAGVTLAGSAISKMFSDIATKLGTVSI